MTLNHEDFKSEWLRAPDVGAPVEFEITEDYVKERETNADGRKYDKFVFNVRNEQGEIKKFSRWKSGVNRMVREVEKARGLDPHTLTTLVGTKWIHTCKIDSDKGKIYDLKFIPKTAPSLSQ